MRLVTRGDLDGLTCATIITNHENIDEILLIHPQDITDNLVEINDTDIIANLPYHPNCAKWFDHHQLSQISQEVPETFDGVYAQAPSAAGLAYQYYGGAEKMPKLNTLVEETDRLDSASLKLEDIEDPKDFILFGYTIDSRSGLGDFEDYFNMLVEKLKTETIAEILALPEVQQRCERLQSDNAAFRTTLREHSRIDGNVVVTDFRPLDKIPAGNRFLIYALYPDVNVSIRTHWGPNKSFVVAAVGHSIFDRSCQTNIGELVSRYGGGGHRGAGSTPLKPSYADEAVEKIVAILKSNG